VGGKAGSTALGVAERTQKGLESAPRRDPPRTRSEADSREKLPPAGSQYAGGTQLFHLRLADTQAAEDFGIVLAELRATVRTRAHSPILIGLRMCARPRPNHRRSALRALRSSRPPRLRGSPCAVGWSQSAGSRAIPYAPKPRHSASRSSVTDDASNSYSSST